MSMYEVYFNGLLMLTVPARSAQAAIDYVAGVPVGSHPLYRAVKI